MEQTTLPFADIIARMIATLADPATVTCRRCGERYVVAPRALLPACPSCGKAPTPMRDRLRDNRAAAVLATMALAMLGVGLSQPFMAMVKLGDRRAFSLVGGIRELFDRGNVVIGTILLVFSLIFPIAKLIAILVATSRLVPASPRARHALHALADATGKYSMLDVLVVAVMIVFVKVQNLAYVEAGAGTIWFGAAVVTSLLASACVRLPREAT